MPDGPVGQRDIILHHIKSAARNIFFTPYKIVINENVRPTVEHQGRYNASTTHEVAIVAPNDPLGH